MTRSEFIPERQSLPGELARLKVSKRHADALCGMAGLLTGTSME